MYHDHFGLQRAPFRITPDTELFYPGGGRGEVLEALVYAVTSGEGIVKVTGEVGTGKTMICRMLEVRLPSSVEVVYIANPSLSPEDILHAIALEMSLPVEASAGRVQVMHALQHRLLELHARNRRVVVFVEEAQGMPMATLEEIRLLSNLETQRDKLLQIVLFGQPELDDALDRASIRQLRERITHSFRLEPLSRDEVREYVRFRMRAVGYRGPDVFKEGAYRQLTRASEGLVRRINILADKALLAAFADDIHNVTSRHMRIAIEDGSFGRRSGMRVWWLGGIAALLLVTVGTLFALDHLPWQQWLRHYAPGQAGWLTAPSSTKPAPPTASTDPMPAAAVGVAAAVIAAETVPASAAPVGEPAATTAAPSGAADSGTILADADPVGTSTESARESVQPAPAGSPRESAAAPASDAVPASAPTSGVIAGATKTSLDSAAPAEPTDPPPAADPPPVTAEPEAVVTAPPPPASAAAPVVAAAAAPPPAPAAAPAPVPASPPRSVVATPDQGAVTAKADNAAAADEPRYVAVPIGSVHADNRLLADRVAATAAWLRTARARNFCIQLLLADVGRQNSLEEFLERMQGVDAYEQIYIYETVIGARGWFGVLYGEFDSFDKARSALEALPEELKRHKPFIRNVRDIVGQG